MEVKLDQEELLVLKSGMIAILLLVTELDNPEKLKEEFFDLLENFGSHFEGFNPETGTVLEMKPCVANMLLHKAAGKLFVKIMRNEELKNCQNELEKEFVKQSTK